MAPTAATTTFALSFLVLLLLGGALATETPLDIKGLLWDYYIESCPNAENIIRRAVMERASIDPSIVAGLIRLHFHDCFVTGCDASILLDTHIADLPTEKEAPPNAKSLYGLDFIDEVKQKLEKECRRVVSCADLLAYAARDAAEFAGIPPYAVPGGRKDGSYSDGNSVKFNLPTPFDDVAKLTWLFEYYGFKQSEMVVLSGAHSIGGAHCSSFIYRIYNDTTKLGYEAGMPSDHVNSLRTRCPKTLWNNQSFPDPKVPFFPNPKPGKMDAAAYYGGLLKGKGLLGSDQVLMSTRSTRTLVERMARNPQKWARKFAKAMIKLGTIKVVTTESDNANIRENCRVFDEGLGEV